MSSKFLHTYLNPLNIILFIQVSISILEMYHIFIIILPQSLAWRGKGSVLWGWHRQLPQLPICIPVWKQWICEIHPCCLSSHGRPGEIQLPTSSYSMGSRLKWINVYRVNTNSAATCPFFMHFTHEVQCASPHQRFLL